MRRFVLPSLLFVLVCLLIFSSGNHWVDKFALLAKRYLAGPFSVRPSSNHLGTEEQWLTEQIAQDLSEILFVAKNGAHSKISELKVECAPQGEHSFNVSVTSAGNRVEQKLELKRYLWAEENYTPLASALLSSWKVLASTPSNDGGTELLDQLSGGGMKTLIFASKEISESLSRAPLDPTLHEKAALIIGCFGLREAAGSFNDTRSALNRMTAHLVLARTLQPEEGDCGKLAKIIQLSLAGRQAEAFFKINALPPSLELWRRALQIRATGDWRVLHEPTKATRLEQLEYFRALRQRGLCPKSRAFLSEVHPGPDPQWIRIAMEENLSVQEGHGFARDSVAWETRSTIDDCQAFSDNAISQSEFVEVLNRPATRCVNKASDGKLHLQVLSWGMLAAFHQRHICHAMVKTGYFLQHTWGVPEEAKKFRTSSEKLFARLTLFPIARRFFTNETRAEEDGLREAVAFGHEHPELITAECWSALTPKAKGDATRGLPPEGLAWFRNFPIFGTTYDFAARCRRISGARNPAILARAVALAPFDHDAIKADAHARFQGHETGEQLALVYAAIKDFDLRAAWLVAEGFKNQPEIYGKMLEPICELHPDYFLILGQYYVDKQMPAEAAAAYQKAFDRAEDRVYVANSTRWIVDYYFDHGRTDEALKIAKDAAEVYSHVGLCTMGHLMERMKRYPAAEVYYKKVNERYEDPGVLNAFYLRNRDQVSEYGKVSERLKAATFPAGIENAQLKDFNRSPHDGVSIASTNTLVAGAHLKAGDVIVAINNVRVHSQKQYTYVRDMESDPNMTLIVWDGAGYSERKVSLPQRRIYCALADFKAR